MAKFCSNCGNEVVETAVVCLKCGSSVDYKNNKENPSVIINNTNTMGATGVENLVSEKSKTTALICCLFCVHRIYVGKIGSNILMWCLAPVGIGAIWWIIDLVNILMGNFRDKYGRFLKH